MLVLCFSVLQLPLSIIPQAIQANDDIIFPLCASEEHITIDRGVHPDYFQKKYFTGIVSSGSILILLWDLFRRDSSAKIISFLTGL